MPFTSYLETKQLDQWFGNTAPSVPATLYVGLVLQLGTLSSALTAGTSYTSLACATNTAAYAGSSADVILLGAGSTTQVLSASSGWSAAATSIAVSSFIANSAYAIGAPFIRCSVYATAQEPTGGSYARVSVTNNTTNFPNATGSTPASKSNGTSITFTTATGTWGTVAGFLVGDNATPGSGNILAFGVLSTTQLVTAGATPSFAPGNLTITQV